MNPLIKIEERQLADRYVPTVNARDLWTFVESKQQFADWMKDRIERFGFVEGEDYLIHKFMKQVPHQGGFRNTATIDYHLTTDMAKELAMVENNDKGREVRRYFIECERRAHAAPTQITRETTLDAFKLTPLVVRAARALGLDKNAAAISANQVVTKLTGTNVLSLLGHQHLDAENQSVMFFTPTELGERMGISGRKFNMLLAEAGLQAKKGEHWAPMAAAEGFCRILDTGKRHGDGTMIQQVKWADSVLKLVERAA